MGGIGAGSVLVSLLAFPLVALDKCASYVKMIVATVILLGFIVSWLFTLVLGFDMLLSVVTSLRDSNRFKSRETGLNEIIQCIGTLLVVLAFPLLLSLHIWLPFVICGAMHLIALCTVSTNFAILGLKMQPMLASELGRMLVCSEWVAVDAIQT